MPIYLLDTNIVRRIIEASRATTPTTDQLRLLGNVQSVDPAGILVSVVTVDEIIRDGCYSDIDKARDNKSKTPLRDAYQRLITAITDLGRFNLIAYGAVENERDRELKKIARNVTAGDRRLSAHALVLNAIIVTENTQDFARIPGVRYINWMKQSQIPDG